MARDRQSASSEANQPLASEQRSMESTQQQHLTQRLLELQQENDRLRAELQRQKQSETALSKRLNHLQQIIDVLPVCISYVNRDRRYEFVSKRYEEWLDCQREDILGKHISEVIGKDAYGVVVDKIDRVLSGEVVSYEAAIPYENRLRYVSATLIPDIDVNASANASANAEASQVRGWYALLTDITERKQTEEALRQSEARFQRLVANIPGVIYRYVLHPSGSSRFTYVSPGCQDLYELTPDEMMSNFEFVWQFTHPEDISSLETSLEQSARTLQPWQWAGRIFTTSGQMKWIQARSRPEAQPNGDIVWDGLMIDISDRKRAETQLAQQTQRDYALNQVIHTIRNSLDLDTIFATAVREIGQLIQVDRVAIVEYCPEQAAWCVVAEYVRHADGVSGIHLKIPDEGNPLTRQLKRQKVVQIDSVDLSDNANRQIAQTFPGAWLLVPIQVQSKTWGCLSLVKQHHRWQPTEIGLARATVDQLAIAIHQSNLYQQVQQLNADLEQQVRERTSELQTALEFEALLKRITDKVRDSLDESHILQTAVSELGMQLNVACCDTALYDLEQGISIICYEYICEGIEPGVGKVDVIAERPKVYEQLFQGKTVQFCDVVSREETIRAETYHATVLACPFVDERGILGDMWLFKFSPDCYSDLEIRLIQQVANQCAIALRQARLYQNTQRQVEELERLHRLKDDFLSTVSHELRTPMSNIKMAIELLDINLFQPIRGQSIGMAANGLYASSNHVWETPITLQPSALKHLSHYIQILHDECQRETELINDLLDLTRLEAEVDPLFLAAISLQLWIPHLIEPFLNRIHSQQQHITITIPDDLPILETDVTYLGRILSELLHNACKYTPTGGQINVSVLNGQTDPSLETKEQNQPSSLLLRISNTGTVPPEECERMFDKFYRIPNNDPWKHGGTGLGLALAKKRVERLGGEIWAESHDDEVAFYLRFPI